MRARTVKQAWAYAFGKHRYRTRQRGEFVLTERTERQRRQDAAEARGNTICWQCSKERSDHEAGDHCEHCGGQSTPF